MRDEETPQAVRALQTNFLSLISHELRAPLQTVNGYLDLALSGITSHDISRFALARFA